MEIQKDLFPEIMASLKETLEWMKQATAKLLEKDQKIAELEAKLKEHK